MLYMQAQQHLFLSRWGRGCLAPVGWDTAAFVHNLHKAKHCKFFSTHDFVAIQNEFRGDPSYLPPQNRFQARVQQSLISTAPTALCELLDRRIAVLAPGTDLTADSMFSTIAICIRKLSPSNKIMILRSIVHSWATSYRYHERNKLQCIFGCGACGPHPMRWTQVPCAFLVLVDVEKDHIPSLRNALIL